MMNNENRASNNHNNNDDNNQRPEFKRLDDYPRVSQRGANSREAGRLRSAVNGTETHGESTLNATTAPSLEATARGLGQTLMDTVLLMRGTFEDDHFVSAFSWHVHDSIRNQHWTAIIALSNHYRVTLSDWNTARHGLGKELVEVYCAIMAEIDSMPKGEQETIRYLFRRDAWAAMVRIDIDGMYKLQARWEHHKALHRVFMGQVTELERKQVTTAELFYALSAGSTFAGHTLARLNWALDHGADIHARSASGDRPLHAAVRAKCHPSVVELLIRRGAKINAVNSHGETALLMSARADTDDISGVLWENGADSTIADRGGVRPAHMLPHRYRHDWVRDSKLKSA